ncbi:unnamed protein product [Prunus armeniaca]
MMKSIGEGSGSLSKPVVCLPHAVCSSKLNSTVHIHKGNMVSKVKLMIAEEEKFQGKVMSLSHIKTAINTIKQKFNLQQLQRFEESCFGHLLLIEDLRWTSQIVHGLLLRKADLKIVSQVNGIKFIVGNKVIQFTAQQFCVVIGLRFGNLCFIPIATNENCSLKRKFFCKYKIVSLLQR